MAAGGGAHVTGTFTDVNRPTVFELISQQSFSHALRPAIFHIIKALAERNPEGAFATLFRHFDEVYLSFDILVQWHYILTRGATLSEAFYGLERNVLNCQSNSGGKLLRIRASYAASVLLPYIVNKVDKWYLTKRVSTNEDGQPNDNVTNIDKLANKPEKHEKYLLLLPLFLNYWPLLKSIVAAVNLYHTLAFAFGHTEYHNLTFRLLGMNMMYSSPNRAQFVEQKSSEIFQVSSWRNPMKWPMMVFRSLGESVLFAVELGSFFVQFLDWWQSDTSRERVVLTSLPIPSPPEDETSNWLQLKKGVCPLCGQKFRNPTALSTSGIVYCYSCVLSYLQQEGKCPLTSLVSTLDHLIRIY